MVLVMKINLGRNNTGSEPKLLWHPILVMKAYNPGLWMAYRNFMFVYFADED